ncbi:MAG: membrane protein [Lysobacteraceae bacterium]|nr:MAG: membrane protein [Xanthomonadaceae bacterium]
MTEILFLLLGIAALVLTWSASRGAAEAARAHALSACQRQDVQLLDQTVYLQGVALRRDERGRVRLLRRYRFAYSTDGIDRHQGEMALLGSTLLWISEPSRPQTLATISRP